MPRRQFNDGQEILYTDLSYISSSLEMELYDRLIYELMNRQQSVVFGDSFYVSYVNSTTLSVKAGNGVYYDSSQVDPEPKTRLFYVSSNTTKTLSAADATNNRIDIVCIRADRATASSASRNVKSAVDGSVSSTSVAVESDWTSTLTVTTGTPAASPAVPATPSGYIKLAEILVTAVTGVASQTAITDKRPRFAKPSSWGSTTAVSSSYTADLDDDMLVVNANGGAIIVTLPLVASSTGKRLRLKKIDSTANTVTLKGNGSELIDGSNTQVISSQYTALTVICDGTQWYLV